MPEDLSRIKEVIKANMRNIQELSDIVIEVKKKVVEIEEITAGVLNRLDKVEGIRGFIGDEGVRMFASPGGSSPSNSSTSPVLDLEPEELGGIISQHPTWLRAFSINTELERVEDETERVRLKRSSSGYVRVIRLENGSEWAYIDEMPIDRFKRLPLLSSIFTADAENPLWNTAWTETAAQVQTLLKGARWEVVCGGKLRLGEKK